MQINNEIGLVNKKTKLAKRKLQTKETMRGKKKFKLIIDNKNNK